MNLPENIAQHNESQLASLLDALETAQAPFSWAICDQVATEDVVLEAVVTSLPNLQHVLFDAGGDKLTSLKEVLDARFADLLDREPGEKEPLVVHLLHVSHTLLLEVLDEEAVFLEQFRLEWEAVHTAYPFQVIAWIDPALWEQIGAQVPAAAHEEIPCSTFFGDSGEIPDPYAALAELIGERAEEIEPARALRIAEILRQHRAWEPALGYYQVVTEAEEVEEELMRTAAYGAARVQIANKEHGVALELLEQAEEATEATDNAFMAKLYQAKGEAYDLERHVKGAAQAYEAAYQRILAQGEQASAELLEKLARRREWQGKLDQAVETFEALIAQDRGKSEPPFDRLARSYQQIGAIRQNQQRYVDALAAFEQGLTFAQQAEDEFLLHALEDSVEDMEKLAQKEGGTGEKKKKKGLFGRLLG